MPSPGPSVNRASGLQKNRARCLFWVAPAGKRRNKGSGEWAAGQSGRGLRRDGRASPRRGAIERNSGVVGFRVAALRGCILAAAVVLGAASGAHADETNDKNAGDKKAGMAADAMRLLEQADRRKAGGPASAAAGFLAPTPGPSSEEQPSELQSLIRIP